MTTLTIILTLNDHRSA